MESFVHLRKGRIPRRLHADLDGLKDDELGRGGFHGGSLYSIPMPPGLISHAPQGVHHGAPEKARERARRKFDDHSRVEWSVIAIDTRRRLTPSAEVLANDLGQH
jgi:hypothetical protein